MSAWTAFGFGFLVGALIFDQLWRHLRRLESRLRERGGAGYYTQADLDAQWERVRHYDFSPAIAMEARQRRDAEERPGPKDDSAGRLRHRPTTPSLQTPQGGDS